jgi:hypothetical protein
MSCWITAAHKVPWLQIFYFVSKEMTSFSPTPFLLCHMSEEAASRKVFEDTQDNIK